MEKYYSSFELYALGDVYIELLENYPCKTKDELLKREGELQRNHIDNIINSNIAGRTIKQWRIDNKEQTDAKVKEYYIKNKKAIEETKKKWNDENKEKVLKRQAEWREKNREKIREQARQFRERQKNKTKN
jgi:transcriptional regulator of heat shock response